MFDFTLENVESAPKVPFSNMNCTVVSLVPYPVKELKPNIIPGYFQVARSVDGKPSVLPVGDSIHWIESPFPKGKPMKMVESSRDIAKAIVNDFIESQLALDSDAGPALFWVEGHKSAEQVIKEFPNQLEAAKNRQNNWFISLIRLADDDWTRYHQHRGISDIQRYAAKTLGMDRDWMQSTIDNATVPCPLCRTQVSMEAIICASCNYIINMKKYDEMKDRIIPRGAVNDIRTISSGSVSTQSK